MLSLSRKGVAIGCALFLLLGCALAQTPGSIGGPEGAQQVFNGFLYANAFGAWSVPQGDIGQFTWSNPNICTNLSGLTFKLFSVGLPIIINDADPTKSESTTVTAVNILPFQCSITTAPLANPHFSFRITSATFGLQEAINYAKQNNITTTVYLTPSWARLGGATGMVTAAQGNANISINDSRTGLARLYLWNGSAYAFSATASGFGILTIDGIPIGQSVPAAASVTSLTATGPISLTGTDSGNQTVTGNKTLCKLNGAFVVDTANSCGWAGSDGGAWCQAADSAIGANPGSIYVSGNITITTPCSVSAAGNNHALYIGPGVTITESASLIRPLSCAVGSTGCVISGNGPSSVIFNQSNTYNGSVFGYDGITIGTFAANWNSTAATTLTSSVSAGASTLAISSSAGFVVGQDVIIKENGTGPARFAEYNYVASVPDGTHITLQIPTEHPYAALVNGNATSVDGFSAGSLTKNWEVANLRITSSTCSAAATGSNDGVAAYIAVDGSIHNVWVDCMGGRGILAGASGYPAARISIKDNHVHDAGYVPTGAGSPGIENYSQSSQIEVTGNHVWRTGSHGIVTHGFITTVANNIAWATGLLNGITGSCFSSDTAENIEYTGNHAINCGGVGFISFGSGTALTTEATNLTYTSNWAQDTGGDCFSLGTSGSGGFANDQLSMNHALRCRSGIGYNVWGSSGAVIAHTLSGNWSEGNTTGYNFGQSALGVRMIGNHAKNSTTGYSLNSPVFTQFIGNTSEGATIDLAVGAAGDYNTYIGGSTTVSGTIGTSSTVLGLRTIPNQIPATTAAFNMGGNPVTGVNTLAANAQISTTVATGTAPLSVVSTTPVGNLSTSGGSGTQQVANHIWTPINTVAFSATPTFDASLGNTQSITLSANVTSSTVSNPQIGQVLTIVIIENGTGGFTFAFPANFKGATVITTTANKINSQQFVYDGTNWNAVAAGVSY